MDASERVVVGTVDSVSPSSFSIMTGTGQKVTVQKQPSTAYWETGASSSARAVIRGVGVAVLAVPADGRLCAEAVAVLPASVRS